MLKRSLKPTQGIIGKRLREARLAAEMTQDALGVAIGLDEGPACIRISRYESGVHHPSLEALFLLAEALHVPPAFLVTENDQLASAILRMAKCKKSAPATFAHWLSVLDDPLPDSSR